MLDKKLLKAHMVLNDISVKAFADAQGWGTRKAYRKLNGETDFTVQEVQKSKELLHLDAPTTNKIFFADDLS